MDEQKLNQFLNEQSLINLSIIEQLNQQAGYLHSIVERLELITRALEQMQILDSSSIPRDSYPMNHQNPLHQSSDIRNNPKGVDTSRAKGIIIDGDKEEKKND